MIDDGTKEHGRDDVVVQDISMHILDALEGRGNRPTGAAAEGVAGAPVPGA